MSITISNWKLIHDAPTNKSISKMAYSFSKSKRFGKEKENKYSFTHIDLKFSITSTTPSPKDQPLLAMALNTTSPKSFIYSIQSPRLPSTHCL